MGPTLPTNLQYMTHTQREVATRTVVGKVAVRGNQSDPFPRTAHPRSFQQHRRQTNPTGVRMRKVSKDRGCHDIPPFCFYCQSLVEIWHTVSEAIVANIHNIIIFFWWKDIKILLPQCCLKSWFWFKHLKIFRIIATLCAASICSTKLFVFFSHFMWKKNILHLRRWLWFWIIMC